MVGVQRIQCTEPLCPPVFSLQSHLWDELKSRMSIGLSWLTLVPEHSISIVAK